MLVHRKVTPQHYVAGTHLYTWVKRDIYSVQQTVCVRFISTDDSLKALSSLGKKRKASQGTEDMTEHRAGIFIMNFI